MVSLHGRGRRAYTISLFALRVIRLWIASRGDLP
jgi:hypothetical protein